MSMILPVTGTAQSAFTVPRRLLSSGKIITIALAILARVRTTVAKSKDHSCAESIRFTDDVGIELDYRLWDNSNCKFVTKAVSCVSREAATAKLDWRILDAFESFGDSFESFGGKIYDEPGFTFEGKIYRLDNSYQAAETVLLKCGDYAYDLRYAEAVKSREMIAWFVLSITLSGCGVACCYFAKAVCGGSGSLAPYSSSRSMNNRRSHSSLVR
jgi:hypothetical protein